MDMADERNPLVDALESVVNAQNVKITRIMRSTRLVERLGGSGKKMVDFIRKANLSLEDADALLVLSKQYDSLREEFIESAQDLVDAENDLAEVYKTAIKTIWKETNKSD